MSEMAAEPESGCISQSQHGIMEPLDTEPITQGNDLKEIIFFLITHNNLKLWKEIEGKRGSFFFGGGGGEVGGVIIQATIRGRFRRISTKTRVL